MKTLAVLFLGVGLFNLAAAADSATQTKDAKEVLDLIPVLIEVIKDREEDDTVRGNAAQTLVNLGRHAVPSLIGLLASKNNDLRIKAATILANMKPGEAQEALPVLFRALKDKKEDRDFRRQATFAISQIIVTAR
jgi:HEAT repeat protein